MTKAKKSNDVLTDLRQASNAACAILTTATAAAKAAEQNFREVVPQNTTAQSNTDGVKRRGAEIAHLEAKDAAAIAIAHASAAVDALEVAEGDELAMARDAGCLLADLTALVAEEDRLAAELVRARSERAARVARAEEAQAALAARRNTHGLPPPASIPRAPSSMSDGGPKALIAVLEARTLTGLPEVKKHADRIRTLRKEETDLLAHIEREHTEREKEKARIADYARRAEESRVAEQKRCQEETARGQAKYAAEQAKQQALADAARARLAG